MTQYAAGSNDPQLDGAVHADDVSRPFYGATLGQAVKRFFRNYAKFSGRASRSEFWYAELFLFLIGIIPGLLYFIGFIVTFASVETGVSADGSTVVVGTGAGAGAGSALLIIGGLLGFVIGVAVLVPSLALWWRRLHDANFPGPMYFLGLIPFAGSIILLVFACLPSKPEGRRFDTPQIDTAQSATGKQ